MIRTTDIHSLIDFQRNARQYIDQIKATQNPMAITVNGEAEVVIQDARAYQKMVDELEHMRLATALLRGEADIAAGRVRDIDDVFSDLAAEHGLPG